MQRLKSHWQLFALVVGVFALWQTPLMIPLKILVVFFHEASHAIMTVLTGGKVLSLSVTPDQGGVVWSMGGNRFWTLTAGYLGSLLIGAALFIGAIKSKADRVIMAICGAAMLLLGLLYVRDVFAFAFTVATGAAMMATSRFLRAEINDLALRLIGLTSMIYVPYDIFSDTILRSSARSDARMLAEEIGGATVLWGGLWLLISVVAIFASLRYGLRTSSNISFAKRPKT